MGKVHGSLARAGKVRAANKKVEKQEKKKPVTGRAMKRYLYNKRFASLKKDADPMRTKPNAQVSQIERREAKEAQQLRIQQKKKSKKE